MDDYSLSNKKAMLIAILHVGVGISIVAISSFLNAEMKFSNWETSTISIFLGIPVLFELSRLIFAFLYDSYGIMRVSLLIGLFTSISGLILLPYVITPVDNYIIIIAVSLFYFGSSIMTTLVDANLTQLSTKEERSKIAGIIQVMRLSGFAIGGIAGSIMYTNLEFEQFIFAIVVIYALISVISIIFVSPYKSDTSERIGASESFKVTINLLSRGLPLLMAIFLFLYPIGLFMQDLIMEPFAIDQFDFDRENVGRVVAIWTSLTLVFVPIGVVIDRQYSRIGPIIIGELLSVLGLALFAVSTQIDSVNIFYFGLVLFGIGNGIASAPAIGMMLEVCAFYPKQLTLLLGFFGIMTTVGRSLAAIFGGFILELTNNSYFILFIIEAVVVFLGLLPLIILDKQLKLEDLKKVNLDPIQRTSIDLN